MRRVFIATLFGGIVLFMWGWVSHDTLPWWHLVIGELQDEAAVTQALQETHTASGFYVFPGWPSTAQMHDKAFMDVWSARHREGPLGILVYQAQGLDPMAPTMFIWGFLISLGSALAAALLLNAARNSLRRYLGRVLFVAGLGLLLAISTDLVNWCWMYYPLPVTLVAVADHIISWLLVGLVLGAVVRPAPAACQ